MITFLSNDNLGPAINWSTLGPPVSSALEKRGKTKVLRPQQDVRRHLGEWRGFARDLHHSEAVFWMQLSARPETTITALSLLALRKRRSAYVMDAWPYAIPKIGQAARIQRLRPCFVAMREGFDRLKLDFPQVPFVHLPFGADTQTFTPGAGVRDIFAFWMGRQHQPMHAALSAYCEARGLKYVSSQGGRITDPAELGSLVARSQYFVVTPPDLDHPERAGGFSPLVMRYLEGLAGGARLLGTLPRSGEFEQILPMDAILQVAPDGTDMAAKLDNDAAEGFHADSVAAACELVRREHSWEARAQTIEATLAA